MTNDTVGKNGEEILSRLEQKAGDYEELYANCAQGTLLALQEQFFLGDVPTLKAATAMSGIALRGETCGAVMGALMALGMFFGREKPEDFASVQRTVGMSRKLCRQFEEVFGSCNCRDVQNRIFGRHFNLINPQDLEDFVKADARRKCRTPVAKAARIAGKMMLDALK